MQHIHVAVGVIVDRERVLIARRPLNKHLGGLWEFPGGKVEAGERVQDALKRELNEELSITIDLSGIKPFTTITYHYPEKHVLLDVWVVTAFDGTPQGNENQTIEWVPINALRAFTFPPANLPIVSRLLLPSQYLITGDFSSENECIRRIECAIAKGIRLIQLRAKALEHTPYVSLAKRVVAVAHAHGAWVLLNADAALLHSVDADGIHLSASALLACTVRPVTHTRWLVASVHNELEMQHALRIGVDAVVVGPVNATTSHPDAQPLGWERFAELTHQIPVPVFALGGVGEGDLSQAQQSGAHGIAAIRAWW